MLAAARVGLILDGTVRPGPAGRGFGRLLRTDWLFDFRLAAGEVTGTAPRPPIHRGTQKPRSCRPFLDGIRCECRGDGGAVMTRSAVPGLLHRLPGHGISRVASKSGSWHWRGLYRSRPTGRNRCLTKRERGGGEIGKASIFFHERFPQSSGCYRSDRYIRNLRIHSQAGAGDCAYVHGQWLGL